MQCEDNSYGEDVDFLPLAEAYQGESGIYEEYYSRGSVSHVTAGTKKPENALETKISVL
ncbi:hypothetical protein LB505_010308 [Fusarium chuoi]|nr:hypothetical protein LB505_010308 [Fusarium chuoi]